MNWLSPGFLFGAAAMALPIVLHMLRRRPKRAVLFPSLRFLSAVQERASRWQHVRRWLVLGMRCAALILLAAAFARPFLGEERSTGSRAIVVVIDNSFSLQARGRWAAEQAWATEQIGELEAGDKLGLLLMAPQPHWLSPLSADTAGTIDRLSRLQPGWQVARVEPALRLAAATLAACAADRREIILLGDHQRVSWAGFDFAEKLPAGVGAVFPPLPDPIPKQAALSQPVVSQSAAGLRVGVTIRNYTGAQKRELRIYRDGGAAPVSVQTLEFGEGESRTLQIDLSGGIPAAARFRIALDPDDLAADDTVYALWRGGGERAVVLDPPRPDSGGDYIAPALAASAGLKPSFRVMSATSGPWPAGAAAVLRNDTSFEGAAARRLDAFLNDGGAALIFADGELERAWLAGHGIKLRSRTAERETWQLRDWNMDHALVAGLAERRVGALLGWDFRQIWEVPIDSVEPLASWSDDAAGIGEARIGRGRVLLCGFSPDRRFGDWPLREVFVPFVHRAVSYLLDAQVTVAGAPSRVGEAVELPAESGFWRAIDGPALGEPAVAAFGSVAPEMPGVYEFTYGKERRAFAVNPAPEESDPASWREGSPWLGLSINREVSPPPSRRQSAASIEIEQHQNGWWWLIAVMAALVLAELGVANRTTR